MATKRKLFLIPIFILISLAVVLLGYCLYLQLSGWGFSREVPFSEQLQRLAAVHRAETWENTQEGSEKHSQILHIYNTHEPLAQGYAVTAEDSWCAAFVSCIAIQKHFTDIIPTECSCERQIELWKEMERWEENDNYMPLPGDYIYYDWDASQKNGNSTGWSDHVGIVVGTAGPLIKVIEGNKDDMVAYRIIPRGHYQIRGYGIPDYSSTIS